MVERKLVCRGFHADKNGKSTIIVDGKHVRGDWVVGRYVEATQHWHDFGKHKSWIVTSALQNGGYFNVMGRYAVIPDTVGQWVTNDRNGNDLFEGDIVKSYLDDEIQGVIVYDTVHCGFVVNTLDGLDTLYLDDDEWVVYRNKFTEGL